MSSGSSLTSSPTPRVRVPQHVTSHVALLVVDYFAYAACPSASARHAARRRLLRLRHAYGCLGTSRGSSLTYSPTSCVRVPQHVTWHVARLVVDYFAYAARPSASARRAARRRLLRTCRAPGDSACRAACRRLLLARRASGCLGTSRGSSHGSSSTTSPTPRIRVPWHVAWLVVDFFAHAAHPGASARYVA
jgi:hypothetical protein